MNANVDLMKILSGNATTARYSQGNVIIKDGEAGDEMYFILTGSVHVYKDYQQPNELRFAELGEGQFFGEMAMFLNRPHHCTVVAASEPVVVVVLNRVNAFQFLEKQSQVAYSIIHALCQRVEDANNFNIATALKVRSSQRVPVSGEATSAAPATASAAKPTAGTAAAPAAKPIAGASTAPTAKPAAPVAPQMKVTAPPQALNNNTDLFPAGHKKYSLEIPATPDDMIYEKKFECPLCAKDFTAYGARETKLKIVERGKDFRAIYENIDITHYELVTCTHCGFSNFDTAMKTAIASRFYNNMGQITAYKEKCALTFSKERKINDIFAGYYLALKGASLFFANAHLLEAKIWLRLMWLYQDCGDAEMEAFALEKAHKAYISVFENTEVNPGAAQQICIIIGELSLRVNDLASAKTYYTKARMHRQGGQVMIKMAEDGIDEIRRREGTE